MELKLRLNQVELNLAGVLIVPYGIETFIYCQCKFWFLSFNRTLWN